MTYIGDLSESVKYKTQEYISGPTRTCTIKRPTEKESDDRSLGFDVASMNSLRGHFVDAVSAGSPAEKGGLRQGDMIEKVNGKLVRNLSHKDLVDHIKPMDEFELEVVSRLRRKDVENEQNDQ
eukprot:TCALIF_02697-PA protein Name:"Similar to SLC9A3R1 Na(+)/H(+) exchange regulatory cofactor NHE-RF1 (Gallus gallus)" AED:0.15 eAED:0.15 QI:0/0/0/0.5/1/1/2/0/122